MEELRLTADGRWLHEGREVTHGRTRRAMDRGIEPWPGGGRYDWVVRVGGQVHPLVVDDTPWLARAARIADGTLILHLNTGERVPLPGGEAKVWVDPVDEGDVLRCTLPDGRGVRLLRTAQGDLMHAIEAVDEGALVLVVGDRRIPLEKWPGNR